MVKQLSCEADHLLPSSAEVKNTWGYRSDLGACSCIVGWRTMLQAGRSRDRIVMRLLDFSVNLILPAALWSWGLLNL
jgi:hypothetical protein